MPPKPLISIIIPNWNGSAFLAECLPAVLRSAEESGHDHELIIIDDASSDNSADIIRRCAPQARLVTNRENIGFGAACNRGAAEASGKHLILLNNDLAPEPEMVAELMRPFDDGENIFGVGAQTVTWDGSRSNHVNMAASIQEGQLILRYHDSDKPCPAMFLQGGSCAFGREAFLKLGGFHSLYHPGYWEDYDVSYQALKAGWKNVYNPRAVGRHIGQGSMIRAYGEERIAEIRFRNRILFLLLNVTDEDLFSECLRAFPSTIAFAKEPRMKCRMRAARGLARRTGAIAAERRRRAGRAKQSDLAILADFSDWQACE
jgi:GT2 family glycosyltransferase